MATTFLSGGLVRLGTGQRGTQLLGRGLNPNAIVANYPEPHYIAHRGSTIEAAEGSMTAYAYAVAGGANSIELDVRLTSDSVPVVMHDATIDRTTTGTGTVSAITLATYLAASIDHGIVGRTDLPTEAPPTVEQVLRQWGNRVGIAAQLYVDAALTPFDALVTSTRTDRRTIIIQTGSTTVAASAAALGYAVMAPLSTISGITPATLAGNGYTHVAPPVAGLTQQFVDDSHTAGLTVVPYSVTTRYLRDRMLALGVDGLFTDDPSWLTGVAVPTTDRFALQVPTAGLHKISGQTAAFASPNLFSIPANASTTAYTIPMQPTNSNAFALTADVKLTTGIAQIWLGNVDYFTSPGSVGDTYDGYLFSIVNSNGTYRLERWIDGARQAYQAFDVAITGYTSAAWLAVKLTVNATQVKVEFPTSGQNTSYTDASPIRPLPYVCMGGGAATVQYRTAAYN